jgi:hypothetical protein
MKKLLMGSVALTLFSISIIIFQLSCKKDATAQTSGTNYTLPPATTSTLGGIVVGNGLSVSSGGTLSDNSSTGGVIQLNKIIFSKMPSSTNIPELWTANYDGTNQTKINIVLGANLKIDGGAKLSPNGQKVFFEVAEGSPVIKTHIYSCNLDGTALTQIIDGNGSTNKGITIQGAY